ncbi:MAG: 4-(cytidine 5'-diphospho)-2-C-methyl-D-erythritol kinase [Pacificimonas sp.]
MSDSETAYAKLNLALHIRRRRDDGYHHLETLFAFCENGDVMRVSSSKEFSMTMDGPFAQGLDGGDDNLVMRAASLLREESGTSRGAALHLEKHLPVASGIGGGSADAAATLRLLNRHWQLDWTLDRLAELALPLGADVPACVFSRTMRGEGVGEKLERIDAPELAEIAVLLANPRLPLSTATVFGGWDGVDRGGLGHGDILAAARAGRNDLTPTALSAAPEIAEVIDFLTSRPGSDLVRMSGSGATCYALFANSEAAVAASEHVRARRPQWWSMLSKLRG